MEFSNESFILYNCMLVLNFGLPGGNQETQVLGIHQIFFNIVTFLW